MTRLFDWIIRWTLRAEAKDPKLDYAESRRLRLVARITRRFGR